MKLKCSKLSERAGEIGIFTIPQQTHPLQATPPQTPGTAADPLHDRGAADAAGPRRPAEPARREKARAATDRPSLRGLGGAAPPEPTTPRYRPSSAAPQTTSHPRGEQPQGRQPPAPGPLTSQRPLLNRRPRAAPAGPRALSLPRLNAPGPRGLAPADTRQKGRAQRCRSRSEPGAPRPLARPQRPPVRSVSFPAGRPCG